MNHFFQYLLKKIALIITVSSFFFTISASAKEIPAAPTDVCPIMVSEKIPDVSLVDPNGTAKSLHELATAKPSVIIFYRGGWCPYCNTHLGDLRKIEDQLIKLGFQVIAISPDKPKYLKVTKEQADISYALLSDSQMQAAKAFGLAYKVEDETLKALKGYNIDLKEHSGESHEMLPVPAAILVNTDLSVGFIFTAPDYTVRVDNEVVLAAARAMLKK